MKKTILLKVMVPAMIIAAVMGCKSNQGNNSGAESKDSTAVETPVAQPEAKQMDTLALYDSINGMLMSLSGEQLWSKDIFTPDYYEACEKINEFSDGDALWGLGSIQEVQSISLTDPSEFKIKDYAHITAEAALSCKDIDGSGNEGTEFRTLNFVLRDAKWLIEDVGGSKESYLDALREQEKNAQ
jgi:hypothetical protein